MILALAQVGDTALSLQPLQPSTIFFYDFRGIATNFEREADHGERSSTA